MGSTIIRVDKAFVLLAPGSRRNTERPAHSAVVDRSCETRGLLAVPILETGLLVTHARRIISRPPNTANANIRPEGESAPLPG